MPVATSTNLSLFCLRECPISRILSVHLFVLSFSCTPKQNMPLFCCALWGDQMAQCSMLVLFLFSQALWALSASSTVFVIGNTTSGCSAMDLIPFSTSQLVNSGKSEGACPQIPTYFPALSDAVIAILTSARTCVHAIFQLVSC